MIALDANTMMKIAPTRASASLVMCHRVLGLMSRKITISTKIR